MSLTRFLIKKRYYGFKNPDPIGSRLETKILDFSTYLPLFVEEKQKLLALKILIIFERS